MIQDLEPDATIVRGPGLIGGQTGKFTYFEVELFNKRGERVIEGVNLHVKISYGASNKGTNHALFHAY